MPRLSALNEAHRRRRDAEIVIAYLERPDVSQRELADQFGISTSRVSAALGEAGARDSDRLSAVKRRQHREGRYDQVDFGPRKRSYWPDCPPDLRDDYRLLRRKGLSGEEAREILMAERKA